MEIRIVFSLFLFLYVVNCQHLYALRSYKTQIVLPETSNSIVEIILGSGKSVSTKHIKEIDIFTVSFPTDMAIDHEGKGFIVSFEDEHSVIFVNMTDFKIRGTEKNIFTEGITYSGLSNKLFGLTGDNTYNFTLLVDIDKTTGDFTSFARLPYNMLRRMDVDQKNNILYTLVEQYWEKGLIYQIISITNITSNSTSIIQLNPFTNMTRLVTFSVFQENLYGVISTGGFPPYLKWFYVKIDKTSGNISVLSSLPDFLGAPLVPPTFNEQLGHVYFCPTNDDLLTLDILTGKQISLQTIDGEGGKASIVSLYYANNF